MANEPTEQPDTVNILDPEGAIDILRNIRQDIRLMADQVATFVLSPRDGQIQYLKTTMDALGGQIYALSIMISVALSDPEIAQEIAPDLDEPVVTE